jgi:hypothetical protein
LEALRTDVADPLPKEERGAPLDPLHSHNIHSFWEGPKLGKEIDAENCEATVKIGKRVGINLERKVA